MKKISLLSLKRLFEVLDKKLKVSKISCNRVYGGIPLWYGCRRQNCDFTDYDSSFCILNSLLTEIIRGEVEIDFSDEEEFKKEVLDEHKILWSKAYSYALRGLDDLQNRGRYLVDALSVFIPVDRVKKLVEYYKQRLGFGGKKVKDLDREGYKLLVDEIFNFFSEKRVYNLDFLKNS